VTGLGAKQEANRDILAHTLADAVRSKMLVRARSSYMETLRKTDLNCFASRGSRVRVPLAPRPSFRSSGAMTWAPTARLGDDLVRRGPAACPFTAALAGNLRSSCRHACRRARARRACGNLPLPLVSRVQVDQRCPGAAVANASHQFPQVNARAGCHRLPGVPKVVEVHQWEPDGVEGREPSSLPEVRPP